MNAYVLVTAARNEVAYIGKTLDSVVAQTIPPLRWLVVSDASTDGTDATVQTFARRFEFVEFLRHEDRTVRGFASQVFAQRFGWERLQRKQLSYDFIGMLDADISLEADYYERILQKFAENPKLGIAGGFIYEERSGVFRSRKTNAADSVAGGIQLFRRECFEAIGGYLPLEWGGMDTVAAAMARMRGWDVRSFPDLKVYHHKPGDLWRLSGFRRCLVEGRMDYSLGTLPVVETLRCLRRMLVRPYLLGSLFRLLGYAGSALHHEPRAVPEEVVEFLRRQHRRRLKQLTLLKDA